MTRWGILGAGNIAHRFAASLQHQPDSVLTAIACRSQEKARAFTAVYPARAVYTDYAAFLADPDVDAVYLALPHGLHREWALRAIAAGKAVLCEKPAVLCAQEMQEIIAAARSRHILFMEAMKSRFVPLYAQVKAQLAAGAIGTLTALETSLCNDMPFGKMGATYHTQPGQGGVLLDSGIYCASWLEDLLPGAPVLTQITANFENGLDFYVDAALRFADKTARLECAFDRAKPRQAVLHGTEGTITVDDLHRPQRMTVCTGGAAAQTVTAPYVVDDFYGQIDHFVKLMEAGKNESDIMPLAASLRCAEILDTIRAGFASQ